MLFEDGHDAGRGIVKDLVDGPDFVELRFYHVLGCVLKEKELVCEGQDGQFTFVSFKAVDTKHFFGVR